MAGLVQRKSAEQITPSSAGAQYPKQPFKISQSERRGRPRVWTVSALSNNGSIKNHCSSVNSSRRDTREILSNYF
jgi:hypothetical protein